MNNELDQIKEIADFLNLKYCKYDMEKIEKFHINAFEISDNNLIYFYPLNDGKATCGFSFYKNGELVIDNDKEFKQITNLDDILLKMVRVFDKALDNNILLDPYSFMLELEDKVQMDYKGKANLVITDKSVRNFIIDEQEFTKAKNTLINIFLDHFICWNFGVSINRNETLKQELEELNNKVIDMGIRKYAGPGLEVCGIYEEALDGLQLYKLPVEKETKEKVKQHTNNKKWRRYSVKKTI